MSREDELFDELLRSKFESKTFTNKPHYWQNAQEMITQGRKTNTSFRPVIAVSIVLVAALGLVLLFSSRSPVSPAGQYTLTASSATVGTSTTATYTSQTTAVQSATPDTYADIIEASTAPARVAANTNENTQQAFNNPNNNKVNNEIFPTANHKRTKRAQRRAHGKEPVTAGNNIQPQQTTQVIDINGKTFTTPLTTSSEALTTFNKTTAYVAYASKAQKSFIAVEAGINAYNPGNSGIWNSVNGQLGIRYYRFINPKLAFSTGLTYARLHQNLPGRAFESTDYDFGKTAASVNITTQRLDYIELPVSALYQLTPKHSLTAGISLGYVIQSADKVTDEAGKQSHQNGYLNGINRWDTQFNLGYQYSISQNIWIRTSYHMGFMDISDNTLFKQAETHTNKGLRLTLGYKIF
jgi:hypothetical protein